ncbi:MAG: FAD-dependent oxidoreductase, partial [Planctomycetota bacterium]|nr:FAD-dependent oxidoreductase [Planctomycetota bacterium]
EDQDAARIVEQAMLRDGVRLECASEITGVERKGDEKVLRYQCGGHPKSITVDQILVSVGRAPNVEGLDLEVAGVEYDRHGVTVDDRLRTSNPRIYAAGDIAGRYKFTHVADAHAQIVIRNALFFGRARASRLVIPWCTYTSPEIAHVGMYEKDAKEMGYAVDTITVSLGENDRALLDGEDDGFFRVHLEAGKDKILGATLITEHAGEMISEISLAMTAGLGLSRVGETIHPYPTQADVFRRAASVWRKRKLTPRAKKILSFMLRIVR